MSAAMKYRILATWLAFVLVALWCAHRVNSDNSLNFEAELDDIFDDGDLKETINKYLDLVPSSHRSRSGASRMMSVCNCKSKTKVKVGISNKHIPRHQGNYHNSMRDILYATFGAHDTGVKENCKCPACPPTLNQETCTECPKPPNCAVCPACPLPQGCQAMEQGQKCPGPPRCQVCISTALSMSNETTPGPNGEPPGIILSEIAHLMIIEREINKMANHKYNSSSLQALIAHPPLLPIPSEFNDENATVTSTTTKKPSKKPANVPKPPKAPRPPKTPRPVASDSPGKFGPTKKPPGPMKTTTKKAKITTTKAANKSPSTKKPTKTPSKKPPGGKKPDKKPGQGMHLFSNQSTTTETNRQTNPDGTVTTSTVTRTSSTKVFNGMALFESNMNLIKNQTLRQQILNIIDNVPENTGGSEAFQAKRLLIRFGENTTSTTFTKRGHSRAFTFSTAKHNVMSLIGHMMEARRRKKCNCPECKPRRECKKCEEPKPCPPKKCDPCRQDDFCPAPEGCPKHKICQKCEPDDTEDPDYNGDPNDLDDIDGENKISESEMNREENPSGLALPYIDLCGNATLNPLSLGKSTGYMNGGEDEIYGEWPSFARLDINMPDGTKGLCGGVLVTNKHILTAGHCVKTLRDGEKDGKNIEAKSFTVHMGDHKKSAEDKFEQIRKVETICRSSKFNDPKGEGSRYDFALLTLDKNVTFNDHIQPACLPWKPVKLDNKKSQCYVVGLGVIKYNKDGNHEFAETVQKMRLQRASCRSWGFRHDDRSRWCWTKFHGKGDSCGGDSGGPILCLNRHKKWTIQGLVSYGSTSCDGSEHSGWVGVYTRIPALLDRMKTDCKL